jgi:hypothetical protein
MKSYETYQHLPGEPMTDRDKKEEHSKFWGIGKWNNFVRPFLPKHPDKEDILIDMGCNAGLFLSLAEDMGFNAIGVDSNEGAVQKGLEWRDKNDKNYQIIHSDINACIDDLPVADYTVLANAHYYFTVNDWFDYLDKLQYKTRYCIIVTDEKRHLNRCWASADVEDIRSFFKNWDEVGFIDVMSQDDPSPRKLRSLCFKSRFVDKVPVDTLDASNHVQDNFWGEIDIGKNFKETKYYRILVKYRKNWEPGRLDKWMQDRVDNYESIKKNGLRKPIIVDKNDRILDGNHRYSGMINLGYKNIFIRKT